jgi:hypothetical protein
LINLAGLTPVGVRCSGEGARLEWRLGQRIVETDFERFRPVQIVKDAASGNLRIVWRDFGELPMTDLFFKATVDAASALAERAELFQTDWEVVNHLARLPDNLPFSGATFHMARTGSTLVSRLLGKTRLALSLSEAPVIDQALFQADTRPDKEEGNMLLRGVIAAFSRPRRPSERHFVVKMTDAMPNTRLPRFRAAFPEVPWIFIYRDPIEVMVSMTRGPTGNIRNWFRNRAQVAERLGMPVLTDPAMWPEEFIARTLRRFCARAVEAAKATPPGLFLAVPYTRLPEAIWETIAPHFGIRLSEKERAAMREEARFSAKRADAIAFQPDSDAKYDEATPRMRALANRFVGPMIEELRALPQA